MVLPPDVVTRRSDVVREGVMVIEGIEEVEVEVEVVEDTVEVADVVLDTEIDEKDDDLSSGEINEEE